MIETLMALARSRELARSGLPRAPIVPEARRRTTRADRRHAA